MFQLCQTLPVSLCGIGYISIGIQANVRGLPTGDVVEVLKPQTGAGMVVLKGRGGLEGSDLQPGRILCTSLWNLHPLYEALRSGDEAGNARFRRILLVQLVNQLPKWGWGWAWRGEVT